MSIGQAEISFRENYSSITNERIVQIKNRIASLNASSYLSPKFAIHEGTTSYATEERQSIGVDFPDDRMTGMTVRCTHFGGQSEMIKFFGYLAEDADITSFMPCEVGGGYLKGVDEAIATCLRKNKTLKALDVHYCKLGEEGVLNIVNALRENASLKYLNIRANGINNQILSTLLDVLKSTNRTLVRFSFTQNNFTDEKQLNPQLIQEIDAQLRVNAQ